MTAPRQYLPGQRVMCTRRTRAGQFLLAPDPQMRDIFGFSLGCGLKRSQCELFTAAGMGNHHHCCLGDPRARRDWFYGVTHGAITNGRNAQLQRSGPLWDARRTHDLVILDDHMLLEKFLYVILNPVRAGLVDHPDEYPGFIILPRHLGRPMVFERPDGYSAACYPEQVEFTPLVPPGFGHLELDHAIAILEQMVTDAARAIVEQRKREGKHPSIGAERLAQLNPFSFPAEQMAPPRRGRPPKSAQEDPYAGYDAYEIQSSDEACPIDVTVRMPPQPNLFDTDGEGRPLELTHRQKVLRKRKAFANQHPQDKTTGRNTPRFAGTDKGQVERANGQFTGFVEEHKVSSRKFRNGERDVVFPAGTVGMRRIAGVRVARPRPTMAACPGRPPPK